MKTQPLKLRLSEPERLVLEQRAIDKGMTVSEWARRVLFRAAGLPVQQAVRKNGRPASPLPVI